MLFLCPCSLHRAFIIAGIVAGMLLIRLCFVVYLCYCSGACRLFLVRLTSAFVIFLLVFIVLCFAFRVRLTCPCASCPVLLPMILVPLGFTLFPFPFCVVPRALCPLFEVAVVFPSLVAFTTFLGSMVKFCVSMSCAVQRARFDAFLLHLSRSL